MTKGSGTDTWRPPKSALLVARRIVRDVIARRLRPGSLLRPERTMLAEYRIGRATLREALRLLEFQGVIELRMGMYGGPVLRAPDASHLANTLVLLMQLKDAPFQSVAELRSAIEPMTSRLAAERRSEAAIDELDRTLDRMRADLADEKAFLAASRRFHDIVAWSCGNPLFGYLVDSLLDITDGVVVGIGYPMPHRMAILEAHDQIHAALRDHDAAASEHRMREHLAANARYALDRVPDVFDRVIPWAPSGNLDAR